MALPLEAKQRFSQDYKGDYLILIDETNYADNSSGLTIGDFTSRYWDLEDLNGIVLRVTLPYLVTDANSATVPVDKDKYYKVTMTIATEDQTFTTVNKTVLTRKAQYKTTVAIRKQKLCCGNENQESINSAIQSIKAAKISVQFYNPSEAEENINFANKTLNFII